MTTRDLPEFDDLELVSKQRTSVTYLAFNTFHFQDVWATLQSHGATTCSINPDPDNEALEVEVFFGNAPSAPTVSSSQPSYALWQYLVSSICIGGITACALI